MKELCGVRTTEKAVRSIPEQGLWHVQHRTGLLTGLLNGFIQQHK